MGCSWVARDFVKGTGDVCIVLLSVYQVGWIFFEKVNHHFVGLEYTLPETNIAHENLILPGKYHQNGGFSMAMLVYRSVSVSQNMLCKTCWNIEYLGMGFPPSPIIIIIGKLPSPENYQLFEPESGWLEYDRFWLVVSNIFYFHPYLGKIPILAYTFQMG